MREADDKAGETPRAGDPGRAGAGSPGDPGHPPLAGRRWGGAAPAFRPGAWALAWAPPSVGNVSVGFDLLGHTLEGPGDQVEVRVAGPDGRGAGSGGVRIVAIQSLDGTPCPGLPMEPGANTAGKALLAMLQGLDALGHPRPNRIEVRIRKGIPLGSGMGGSAASAVAAVTALNALLHDPLPTTSLYPWALAGEAVASGAPHGDNVGPQLLGGLVLALPDRLLRIPLPPGLHATLVHPHQRLETRRSREVLAAPHALETVVEQSGHLARFLAGCFRGELELIREGLRDVLVEPRRAPLIPGFREVRDAALGAGALGAGISGGGPSLFAWFTSAAEAREGAGAMVRAFRDAGVEADALVGAVEGPAARILEVG